jgi:hypothetical protein
VVGEGCPPHPFLLEFVKIFLNVLQINLSIGGFTAKIYGWPPPIKNIKFDY